MQFEVTSRSIQLWVSARKQATSEAGEHCSVHAISCDEFDDRLEFRREQR
jgi:hypothetical protein